jgi:hypothetical protein
MLLISNRTSSSNFAKSETDHFSNRVKIAKENASKPMRRPYFCHTPNSFISLPFAHPPIGISNLCTVTLINPNCSRRVLSSSAENLKFRLPIVAPSRRRLCHLQIALSAGRELSLENGKMSTSLISTHPPGARHLLSDYQPRRSMQEFDPVDVITELSSLIAFFKKMLPISGSKCVAKG